MWLLTLSVLWGDNVRKWGKDPLKLICRILPQHSSFARESRDSYGEVHARVLWPAYSEYHSSGMPLRTYVSNDEIEAILVICVHRTCVCVCVRSRDGAFDDWLRCLYWNVTNYEGVFVVTVCNWTSKGCLFFFVRLLLSCSCNIYLFMMTATVIKFPVIKFHKGFFVRCKCDSKLWWTFPVHL